MDYSTVHGDLRTGYETELLMAPENASPGSYY